MRTPRSLRGTRAASATLVKTRGDRDSPKGRTLYWYARPSNANRRNGLCRGRIETWKYASFRSIAANQSRGRTHPKMRFSASTFWTAACEVHGSKLADPRSVVTHRFSWAQWSKGCKTPTSYRLEGPVSIASFASRTAISAHRTGASTAFTEVKWTPLNLGGRRANWIA